MSDDVFWAKRSLRRSMPFTSNETRSLSFDEYLCLHAVKLRLRKDAFAHQLGSGGVGPIFDDRICQLRGYAGKGRELLLRCLIDVERPFAHQSFGNAAGDSARIPLRCGGSVGGVLSKRIGVVREAAG